jgi:tetratricopeptide (TPR) repeat protein
MLALTINSDVFTEKIVTSSLPELNITVGDLFVHYQTLSPYILNDDMTTEFSYYDHFRFLSREEWAELNSPEMIERLVNNIIEVNLFDYEARQMGYDDHLFDDPERETITRDPEGSRFDLAVFQNPEVHQLRRHIILKTLFERLVIDVADPTTEQIRQYYQDNLEDYTVTESRRLQIFVYDTEEEARTKREIVTQAVREGDEWAIINLIRSSGYPQIVRAMQFVERDRPFPYFGEDSTLYELVWKSVPGELSDIHQSDTGLYYFLAVSECNPAYIYPLEQFEREITNTLTFQARSRRWQEVVRELFDEYQVTLYPERLFIILEAEEYFALAEQAQNRGRFLEAIGHYNSIIKHHKNNDDDYRALFAKAFIYARELGEEDKGIELFQQLIDQYPPGDLHSSAEFMIESFSRGEIPVDNLD